MNKLCHEGVVSIKGFLAGAALIFAFSIADILALLDLGHDLISNTFTIRLLYIGIWYVALNIAMRMKVTVHDYQVRSIL